MSKINLLSSKIYNRIAAGEVVERPFSVVKELIENSLDANAKNISIDVLSGGISSIRITDDGDGIEKTELKKALLPHATSKISTIKDLDNINSFGFRGEALASIASVSKITIVSKPKNQEIGGKIYSEGGTIFETCDFASSVGTEITVNNLFFNTPVREKFLHSERSEENEISATVARFILGNPSVAFKYTADNKLIYQSYGDGFEPAMACIYGIKTLDDCFYIDTEKNGIKIKGYIGKHYFTKGNRSYQTVFLNGRYVINQTISAAISNAYSSYVMKRQYPFYVISIEVPTEIVDVNVHPNKLDVRFNNNQIIYSALYSVISKVLDGSSEALNIVTNTQNNKVNTYDLPNKYDTQNTTINNSEYKTKYDFSVHKLTPDRNVTFNDSMPCGISSEAIKNNQAEKEAVDIFAENKAFLEKLEREKQRLKNAEQEVIPIKPELRYVGQVLNTFLVFDDGLDLYLADQHAAHERILFDKLNDDLRNSAVVTQPLLIPYILNVNNKEYNFLCEKMPALKSMGIDVNEFGNNAFKVSEIPAYLSEMNLQKFFDDVLSDVDTLKVLTVNNLLMEKLAQKACKAAIKAGDKLRPSEIDVLLEKLKDNLGLKCPHGRPVAVRITRTEIDKWFKRIV